jgi:hypothetical protein
MYRIVSGSTAGVLKQLAGKPPHLLAEAPQLVTATLEAYCIRPYVLRT